MILCFALLNLCTPSCLTEADLKDELAASQSVRPTTETEARTVTETVPNVEALRDAMACFVAGMEMTTSFANDKLQKLHRGQH